MTSLESLQAGQVGYAVVTLKQTRDVRVGDTLFIASDVMPSEHAGGPPRPPSDPIPAFQPARQMVWAGVFPEDPSQSDALQQAMGRVMLSDAAISATPEVSEALGLGFRCGFLGLLHLDVFKQRMEGEFGVKVIACAPTVPFRVGIGRGEGEEVRVVESAAQFPDVVTRCEEPLCEATILVPQAYLKNVEVLCIERRGEQTRIEFLSGGGEMGEDRSSQGGSGVECQGAGTNRVLLTYSIPMQELVVDFAEKLKSVSRRTASFDFEPSGYRPADIVKVGVRLNGKSVDSLAFLCPRQKARSAASKYASRLKALVPPAQFEIGIQCTVGGKVVAKEKISALRKDVTAKCYGGDMTRKIKLLNNQKEGKKRMREIGNVKLPPEAFIEMMRLG
uniref:Uncharacterized protein n=1 Tax=Chromera velia CCMP2878 TaxID=1169474 RepID=A0A0G4HNV2_9ALVE|eukprot:Cvel_29610.t1-p1 / transcript=Cvel_29610.t1 / gene=Cvel_29610 / organism=Chromera_velia_CCMP2878 / gene_product=Elongation factor 4, putative / transcript_product=Elongation factor 4, putative / location=Cvel_scaffold4081:10328-11494(-) / protein_length=389 / sequence_SO=supercontig / SO=protein_coding / is_pseudo=false